LHVDGACDRPVYPKLAAGDRGVAAVTVGARQDEEAGALFGEAAIAEIEPAKVPEALVTVSV